MFKIPKAYLLKLNNINPDSIQAKTMSGGDWAALRDAAEETVTISEYRRAKEAEVAEAIKPFLELDPNIASTQLPHRTTMYLGEGCWYCYMDSDIPALFGDITLEQYRAGLDLVRSGDYRFGPLMAEGYLNRLGCLTREQVRAVMRSYEHTYGLDGYDD